MPDGQTSEAVSGEAAASALAYLTEMSPDLRGGAILGAEGDVLAASGRPERWRDDAAALLAAADKAGEEPVEQLHIASEQGEVFAVRQAGLVALAVTDRFALASLLLFDMRAILRDLAEGGDGKGRDGEREADAA
jgi:predicted regulator of Ras-like GTPase activity (Roadblock/LC7/MglB family)